MPAEVTEENPQNYTVGTVTTFVVTHRLLTDTVQGLTKSKHHVEGDFEPNLSRTHSGLPVSLNLRSTGLARNSRITGYYPISVLKARAHLYS